jgi:transposase
MSKAKVTKGARERRFFSAEFKDQSVRLLGERRAKGVSLAQVGRELGVRPDILRRWAQERDAGRHVSTPDPSPSSEAAELRRLRRELEVVRQERDFLKKASAYFARESR